MTITNWGNLSKSTVDAETIEEAISRLISAHNNDILSHDEVNGSLYAHRTNTILDHPQSSVLADKLSSSELIQNFLVASGEGFTSNYSDAFENMPSAYLLFEQGTNIDLYLRVSCGFSDRGVGENRYSKMFNTIIRLDNITFDVDSKIGWFNKINSDYYGLGFIILNGQLKGTYKNFGIELFTDEIEVDLTEYRVLRVLFDAYTQEALFYVDGGLYATLSIPLLGFYLPNFFYVTLKQNSASSNNIIYLYTLTNSTSVNYDFIQ